MSRKERVERIIENLTIESVAAEGKAIARTPEGIVVFIEYGVPGDVVDVKVLKDKKKYIDAAIVRIVKPSEHRIKPFASISACAADANGSIFLTICSWKPSVCRSMTN